MCQVVMIPFGELQCGFVQYGRNPDLIVVHRQSSFYIKVRDSLGRDGLQNPLIVSPKDASGKHSVRVGNNRFLAMEELIALGRFDAREVPCFVGNFSTQELKAMKVRLYRPVVGIDNT